MYQILCFDAQGAVELIVTNEFPTSDMLPKNTVRVDIALPKSLFVKQWDEAIKQWDEAEIEAKHEGRFVMYSCGLVKRAATLS